MTEKKKKEGENIRPPKLMLQIGEKETKKRSIKLNKTTPI